MNQCCAQRHFYSALDAGVKIRPTVEELAAIGPEFSNRWAEYFADAPDKPVMWLGSVAMSVTVLLDFNHESNHCGL